MNFKIKTTLVRRVVARGSVEQIKKTETDLKAKGYSRNYCGPARGMDGRCVHPYYELVCDLAITEINPSITRTDLLASIRNFDWGQVVFHQAEPCFHLQADGFCGRAKNWHDTDTHKFVPLVDFLTVYENTK